MTPSTSRCTFGVPENQARIEGFCIELYPKLTKNSQKEPLGLLSTTWKIPGEKRGKASKCSSSVSLSALQVLGIWEQSRLSVCHNPLNQWIEGKYKIPTFTEGVYALLSAYCFTKSVGLICGSDCSMELWSYYAHFRDDNMGKAEKLNRTAFLQRNNWLSQTSQDTILAQTQAFQIDLPVLLIILLFSWWKVDKQPMTVLEHWH